MLYFLLYYLSILYKFRYLHKKHYEYCMKYDVLLEIMIPSSPYQYSRLTKKINGGHIYLYLSIFVYL